MRFIYVEYIGGCHAWNQRLRAENNRWDMSKQVLVSASKGFISLLTVVALLLPISGGVSANMNMNDDLMTSDSETEPAASEEVLPVGIRNSTDEYQVAANSNPLIDVWYGLNQQFGLLGNPQDRINILGNVSDPDGDDITLRYSLNGSSFTTLTLGTSNVRLVETGDFNLEIFDSDLDGGPNTIILTATDDQGGSSSVTVTVNYQRNNEWPLPYIANWQGYSAIQNGAEVVDGKWSLTDGGVRTEQVGYDRLIALGNYDWTSYQVTVPFKLYSADTSAGGIGVILRWKGHLGSSEPTTDWTDMGAYGYYSYRKGGLTLRLTGSDPSSDFVKPMSISYNTTYILKMQVENGSSGSGGLYRLKIWPSGTSEPSGWDLTGQDDSADRSSGSMLLVAHYVDAWFGNVTITPINLNQTYTLSVQENGSGNVTVSPQKSSYAFGEEVTLTATPSSGWSFTGWSGGASGKTNPLKVVMDGNLSITANFQDEGGPNPSQMLFLPYLVR